MAINITIKSSRIKRHSAMTEGRKQIGEKRALSNHGVYSVDTGIPGVSYNMETPKNKIKALLSQRTTKAAKTSPAPKAIGGSTSVKQQSELNPEKNRVLLCGIGKMENHYIREWVEHYKNIGFDNICLYDNNDVDGERFETEIGDYIADGFVILKDVRGKKGTKEWRRGYTSLQLECYNDCYKLYGKSYDWIAFFDCDEFLDFEQGYDINSILGDKKYKGFDAIKVSWIYYDDNELLRVENGNYSIKRFTVPSKNTNIHNKCSKVIVRTGKNVVINSPHGFTTIVNNGRTLKLCDVYGRRQMAGPMLRGNEVIRKIMFLNHYRYKTIEEYVRLKVSRGWPDDYSKFAKMTLDYFFERNEKTKEKVAVAEQVLKELSIKPVSSLIPSVKCCGCGACAQTCPKNAITMVPDSEGFLYPKIDTSVCVNCRACTIVCPNGGSLKKDTTKAGFACINNDVNVRLKSSSGGVFYPLAEKILSGSGVVFGVKYNEDMDAVYDYIESMDDIDSLMRSKYTQAAVGDSFQQAREFLNEGRDVLFVGTPCHISGLLSFLKTQYDNLYTVEIACHGVPAPNEWKDYVKKQSQQGNIVSINQRDKTNGWRDYAVKIDYENGETKLIPHGKDEFIKSFLSNKHLRASCYGCPYKNGCAGADITIGDFWSIDKINKSLNDNKGISLVIANSEKGLNIVNSLDSLIKVKIGNLAAAKAGNGGFSSIINGKKEKYISKDLTPSKESKKKDKNSGKKVGIISLRMHYNYGGVMQAYALSQVLKRLGFDPKVIESRTPHLSFVDKNIPRRIITSYSNIKEHEFDAFVVGSDQVWRPKYNSDIANAFLKFAKGWDVKRIAYAPSFGSSNWEYSTVQTQAASALIKKFDAVSVREDSGVELCKKHLNATAEHVLDPTLLLTAEDYRKVISKGKTNVISGGLYSYILDQTLVKNKIICAVKEKTGTKSNNITPKVRETRVSMEAWLDYFNKAEYIITDSFHGCVFSIIFGKPFVCFNNAARGGARITSLLRTFGLTERIVNPATANIEHICDLLKKPIAVEEQLEKEREKSIEFLKTNLGSDEA